LLLTGKLGKESYDTVRETHFDEQTVVLHDLYDGEIPDDMTEQACTRSAKDNLMQRRMRSARDDAASDAQKAKPFSDVAAIKANYTSAKKEEQAEMIAAYHDNMMEQMTEEDYVDCRAKNDAAQKRYRDRKRAEKNGSLVAALQPRLPDGRPRASRGSNPSTSAQIKQVPQASPSRDASSSPPIVTTTTPELTHLSDNEM
jgi:hypothetical protein